MGRSPGGAVAKVGGSELLSLGLSPDYRQECGICDRNYMHMHMHMHMCIDMCMSCACCAAGPRVPVL